ncbi:MAG: branched-chain amino acid ABC transporter permease, partial [Alphaproteobacteria bacterium]
MTARQRTHFGTACVVAIGLAFLFGLPALGEIYLLINATIYASFALLALSLGLIWGFAGILCFGQAAFFGLGGYAYAIAALNFGDTSWAVPIGMLVPAVFALLLGYFMFWKRISDVYLGVITLTVSLILYRFFNQTAGDEWTIGTARLGGFNGIPGTPPLNWPGDRQAVLWPEEIFMVAVGALILGYLLCKLLLSSGFGRTIVAVRENEVRTGLLGYDVRVYKLIVFAISGALAGLAGILFANTGFVSPNMFSL